MYRLTRSCSRSALLGLAELVPLLITAFVGGALADAVDRRRLVVATDLGAAGSIGLMANGARAEPSVALLYLAAGLMSAFNGLQRPSLDAMLRGWSADEMPAAAALSAFRGSLGMIAGPAIGGVLLGTVGLVAAYGSMRHLPGRRSSASSIESVPARDDAEPPSLARREGFRYARSRQELIGTYVVDFVAMVFGMPLALFPALAGPARRPPRWPALRRARGRRARRQPDRPLDAARPPSRPRGDGGSDRLGPRHRRLRRLGIAVAGAGVPGDAGGADRSADLPDDDVEPDHPRRTARPPGRHRDGQLHERPAARPRRGRHGGGGRRRARVGGVRRRSSASWASSSAARPASLSSLRCPDARPPPC